MKRIILFMLLIGLSTAAWSQSMGTLRGKVQDQEGSPIPFASVILHGTNYGVATSEDGSYQFSAPAGNYTLDISAVGFASIHQKISLRSGQVSTAPTASLKVSEAVLKEVTITGASSSYKVENPSESLRLNESLIEIPQNIQVITAQVLEDQQVMDMADGVIRNVSGASRLEHWGNLYARINMRGSRAAAFRNGMNVTSNWGPLTEDMSFVSNIEFVKGPAGFMMSNGDPSGIYNVVTKKPTGLTQGEVTMTMGSFDLYRGTMDLDGKLSKDGKLLYRLNVMGQSQNSFQDFTFQNRYSIAPVISYQLSEDTKLTLEYVHQHVKMSNVGSAYVFSTEGYGIYDQSFTIAEPGLDPTRIDDNSVMANLQHTINSDWKVTGQLAYFNYQQEGSSMWLNYVDADANLLRYVSIWDALGESAYGQVYLNGEVKTGAVNHRILAGLDMGTKEYTADWSQSHQLDSAGAYFNMNNPVYGRPVNGLPQFDRSKSLKQRANTTAITQSYSGFYAQDELGFFDNTLRLTLAARYTYTSQNSYGTTVEDSKLTPRFGLSYSIDKETSVYALFDQTFVPQSGLLSNGDKPKPITGNNMELGVKHDFFGGKLSTSLSAYRILENNQLVNDPEDPTGQFSLQIGQSRAQGIEFDARGHVLPGLEIIANYAYTDNVVTKAAPESPVGGTLPGFAKHLANAWIIYSLQEGPLRGFGLSAGFTYQGDRSTWNWAQGNQLPLPNYFKIDGGLSWENDNLSIRANVFNVLNEYLYSGSAYATYYYYQAEAPRNARLSLGYRF